MRIAVLADIHGNLRALESVLDDLAGQSPDLVVNLGDHLSGPLEAAATADLLIASGFTHIRGNHDRQLLDIAPQAMGESDKAAHTQLAANHIAWLAGLPATETVNGEILLVHGSPRSDLEYLLESVGPGGVSLAKPEEIRRKIDYSGLALLCGHTHIPRFVRLQDGLVVLNPGSVGVPAYSDSAPMPHAMETGSPHARYALLERIGGRWRATFRAVDYDWRSASDSARLAGRLDWAHALATGYALR